MKKLQKILIMTVLVAMMVGLGAIASSAAATAAPVKELAVMDGSVNPSVSSGSQRCEYNVISKTANKYYEINFIDSGANANFTSVSGNYAFLGKGDYIVMEFDFMAEDWTKVKSILVGWNSRNASGGALNDMHFSFGNEGGKPKISGNPLSGSITLSDSQPGQWHHFTMVVQIGGEHVIKQNSNLTAVKGQDAVEAYAYIDGEIFAQNLIGDGKEFWSTDTTFWQSFRLTASGANQNLCLDNIRIVQYETSRELREFFNYRNKNDGAFPSLNEASYPFVAYDEDYDYPLGVPTCKVVELNGNETYYDRFDKATKRAAASAGAKVVLMADIENVEVKYPVKIDRAGFQLYYTVVPSLRAEESTIQNPITGELSSELSFIKKTKYAYYRWEIDHTGEAFDSRGYTPLAVGEAIAYNGNEFAKNYYRDGVLYTFGGQWRVNGVVLEIVPAYAVNSYYTLSPVISTKDVYAIVETMDGSVTYACSSEEVAAAIAAADKGATVTLVKDVILDAPLMINNKITLDLAGKKITSSAEAAIQLANTAAGTVITSSEAGAKIVAGVAFETACAFTFEGKNVIVTADAALKVADGAVVKGLVIDGGVFLLSGDTALVIGAEASLAADINATLIADGAALADPAAAYELVLGGALSGVSIPASAESKVVLAKNTLLSDADSFAGALLPEGVSLAESTFVIASAKVEGENGLATAYKVVDASEAVLIIWEEGVAEYVLPGESVYYLYSDYYDATKFYTPNGQYSFELEGESIVGNVVDAAWAGITVAATPLFDATSFYIAVEKTDGTFDAYVDATSLSTLMTSGKYEAGAKFVLGHKNMLLENVVLNTTYTLDLNGYGLYILGANKIVGATLTVESSVAGAVLYSDAADAFICEGGAAFVVDETNVTAYFGE